MLNHLDELINFSLTNLDDEHIAVGRAWAEAIGKCVNGGIVVNRFQEQEAGVTAAKREVEVRIDKNVDCTVSRLRTLTQPPPRLAAGRGGGLQPEEQEEEPLRCRRWTLHKVPAPEERPAGGGRLLLHLDPRVHQVLSKLVQEGENGRNSKDLIVLAFTLCDSLRSSQRTIPLLHTNANLFCGSLFSPHARHAGRW